MLLRPSLAAVLVVAAALAGCASNVTLEPGASDADAAATRAPLTEATLAFGAFLALKVPSYDGTLLHVDVQLPEGDGPFPTIIEYTPYSVLGEQAWGAVAERGLYDSGLASHALADYYVPRGYAVGVAHVRGTGESGGCLTVGGPNEGKDGYAIVEELAAQPWSNGRIALMGTSYVGTTPIETAVLDPPHLTTIIPISAVTEWYKYYFENGEQRMNGSPPPGASYPDPAFWIAMGIIPGGRTLAASPDDAQCPAEMMRNFWLQDDYNAYWRERDHGALAAQIRAPVLFAQGWRDENVASNMITDFWENVSSEKRAFLTQHAHGVPQAKEEWWLSVHRWLDHWMLDLENGALDLPPIVVEDNRGLWRAEAAWPPADAAMLRLHLGAGGTLANATPDDGAASWTDEPLGSARGEFDGVTFLTFETEALGAPLHVAGDPVVHLAASSNMHDTQFSVLLYDVDPQGNTAFVTRGYLDARHRDSLETGEDLTPGERYAFEWRLHPRDHFVEEGHRLRLVVKSSDPYIIPDETRATNTLYFGEGGSWVELPVIGATSRQYDEVAPIAGVR